MKRIRTESVLLVKGALSVSLLLILTIFVSTSSRSADNDVNDFAPSTTSEKTKDEEEVLPRIEARTYGLKVVRRSNSARTYLFDDVSAVNPPPGKIFLLKREEKPVMAFRVLKTYPEKNQFAAKRVRRYGDNRVLERNATYMAVEKISDIKIEVTPPPPATEEELRDLADIENEPENPDPTPPPPDIVPYDPELDSGSSPVPEGIDDPSVEPPREASTEPTKEASSLQDFDDAAADDDDRQIAYSAREVALIDKHSSWLSAQTAYFRNNTTEERLPYYTGGGLRYGLTLGRMLFLKRGAVQDSLTMEAGVFLYRVVGLLSTTTQDAYTVLPLIGTLRYNILLNESLWLFFYGGVMTNQVISSANDSSGGAALLGSTLPSGGGGLMFRVGPQWHARVDVGIDVIGAGLVLRF